MRTAGKKKRSGRQRAPQRRPVLAARVPEEFHARIAASARTHRRNASEELMWLAERGYEWEEARGAIETWLAQVRRRFDNKLPVEQMLREWGFTKIPAIDSTVAEPGVDAPKWVISSADVTREKMAEMAAIRAIEKALKRS